MDLVLTGIDWVDVILVAGAIVAALYTIWRRVLGPLIRGIDKISDSIPILLVIASEFRPNGGNSLRDAVDRLTRTTEENHELMVNHMADDKKNFAEIHRKLDHPVTD